MGQLHEKVIGEFPAAQYYIEPSDNSYWSSQGLKSLLSRYETLRHILIEPPYTERYVRWCERSGVNHSLLLDFVSMGYYPYALT